MKSMTGFAQGRFELPGFSCEISFKSLNHRFLDFHFKGNGISQEFERIIKDLIRGAVYRGKIEVTFDMISRDPEMLKVHLNEPVISEVISRVADLKDRHKLDVGFSLDSLLRIPMIFHLDYGFENLDKKTQESVKQSISEVFTKFMDSRSAEGAYTHKELLASIGIIKDNVSLLEQHAEAIENESVETYRQRIERFVKDYVVDEKRILQEAAILAEKNCVAEEINRLQAHIDRLTKLLSDKKVHSKGREADFLTQEMVRETHTIAAKTDSLDIHECVILVRREIEKIKQQVQNVE